MKNYLKYLVVFGFALLTACKKDSAPEASAPAEDTYMRADNASSEVDHQIYLVYQQTKVPVLYTDTVSKNPLELVNLNYQMAGSNSSYIYSYPKNKQDILAGIAFVRDKILPALGPKIKVHSISLLDTLKTEIVYSPTYIITTNYTVIQGLTTLAIAKVPSIAAMTPDELVAYQAEVFTNLLLNPLDASGLMPNFYKVSTGYYDKSALNQSDSPYYLPWKDKREYGFLLDGSESDYYYVTPSQSGDLKLFLSKILSMSAADFEAENGNYPLVMNKYNMLKEALNTLGFDLTKV